MAKCPKCNKRISDLINQQSAIIEYVMDKQGNYEDYTTEPDDEVNIWLCPLCREELFDDEEEAIKFLKNKKVKEE